MRFKASCVTWQHEPDAATLGFADDEIDTKEYLLLERTLKPDKQERELGMDRLYIELNSQKRSAYGSVEEVRFERSSLVFRLDMATASKVSNGEAIEVEVDNSQVDLKQLAKHLRFLIGAERIAGCPSE
jgi:hypothetical protein